MPKRRGRAALASFTVLALAVATCLTAAPAPAASAGQALTAGGSAAPGFFTAAPAPVRPAVGGATTFTYTGGEQSYEVPSGVSSVHVMAVGGRGGGGGGFAAAVTADLSVDSSQKLYVEVGGNGRNGAGGDPVFGGGAVGGSGGGPGAAPDGSAGGGASDVRTCSISATTCPAPGGSAGSRLLVAGAGGGSGGNGGGGGSAGRDGADARDGGGGGGAGTTSQGGAGGWSQLRATYGAAGALATGGRGADSHNGDASGGGGGGGGLYGGGGGGSGTDYGDGGGGGGGGSSFIIPSAGGQKIDEDHTGQPLVIITPDIPPAPPVHVPPIGAPVDTIDASSKAIRIDGYDFGRAGGGPVVHLAVVDRRTLATQVADFSNGDAALPAIAAQIAKIDLGVALRYYVVLSAPSGFTVSADRLDDLNGIMKSIGAPKLTLTQAQSPLSAVGIRGTDQGTAFSNWGGSVQETPGDMSGYFRFDSFTTRYDFVFSGYVPFATSDGPASAAQNTMRIGNQSYSATLQPGTSAGFHVVVVDSASLAETYNAVLPTNTGSMAGDQAFQAKMLAELESLTNAPHSLVFIQSVGHPGGSDRTPVWADIATQIGKLGGTPAIFNALDGTGGYAFAGRAGATSPLAEVSEPLTKDPAHLTGLLARSQTTDFQPMLADPLRATNDQLLRITYQAPTPFPAWSSPGERDAETWIGKVATNICASDAPTCDVRAQYYEGWDKNWSEIESILDTPTNPRFKACPDGPGFTNQECETVRKQLSIEIGDVVHVHNYLDQLQEPFTTAQEALQFNLKAIGNKVLDAVAPRPGDDATSQVFNIISFFVKLGVVVPGPVSNVAAGLSALFSLLAYFTRDDGQPDIYGPRVTAKVGELSQDTYNRFLQASAEMSSVGKIIVSDSGKLRAVADAVDTESWRLGDKFAAVAKMRQAGDQWYYEALLPVVYKVAQVTPGPPGGLRTANDYDCRESAPQEPHHQLLADEPASAQFPEITGFGADGAPRSDIMAMVTTLDRNRGSARLGTPPASLIDPLFRGLDDPRGGYGLQQLQFFSARVFSPFPVGVLVNGSWCPHSD